MSERDPDHDWRFIDRWSASMDVTLNIGTSLCFIVIKEDDLEDEEATDPITGISLEQD